jgi:hypothetical protein
MRTIYNPLNYTVETKNNKIFVNGIKVADAIIEDYDLAILPEKYINPIYPKKTVGNCGVVYLSDLVIDTDQEFELPGLNIYANDDYYIIDYMGKWNNIWGKFHGIRNGAITGIDRRSREKMNIHILGKELCEGNIDTRLYKLVIKPVKEFISESSDGHYNPYGIPIGQSSKYRQVTDCGWPGNGEKYTETTKLYTVLGAIIEQNNYSLCIFKDTDDIKFINKIEHTSRGYNVITFSKCKELYYLA